MSKISVSERIIELVNLEGVAMSHIAFEDTPENSKAIVAWKADGWEEIRNKVI